ncbi:pilus assembly FimT family protein [Kiritimatiella glycovorans]|uniref:Putative major pilin subunit n=1 Tax=Kiritimatiella glycovorans TaxID=1307763 RepID=A0A0G3EAZ4_9BACT|nr:prepilin-type N-terminal cleavage/methylation domain-containing protein [Kiritimatiella glycovorans]AKJ63443.1 putative major pilin subunit [Kiritimatiella glycovorans]
MGGHRNAGRGGFTLIELMMVILVMGIIATIAIPAFQGSQSRAARVDAAARELQGAVSLARQWAITKRQHTYLLLPDDNCSDKDKSFTHYAIYACTNETTCDDTAPEGEFIRGWKAYQEGVVVYPPPSTAEKNFALGTDNYASVKCLVWRPNGRMKGLAVTTPEIEVYPGRTDESGSVDGSPEDDARKYARATVVINRLTGISEVRNYEED